MVESKWPMDKFSKILNVQNVSWLCEEIAGLKQTLDRPTNVEVLTLKTDDVENTGVSLAKNGAVFLGLNSSNDRESFYLLQGHLILVSKRD
jgi:hypothetical protein